VADPETPYQIRYTLEGGILWLKTTGTLRTEADFHRFAQDAIAIILQSGAKKVLSDVRDLAGPRPGVLGAVTLVESFPPALLRVKMAAVERIENRETMRHRENAAVNRGFTVKYFTDPEQALTWLQD